MKFAVNDSTIKQTWNGQSTILKIEKISLLKLNARNAPGAHSYCNCQLLKISQIKKFNTMKKSSMGIILNMKISRSTVYGA